MSSACVDLFLFYIKQNCGVDCESICRVLLYNEWSTLKEIKRAVKNIKSNKIVECLQFLNDLNIVLILSDDDSLDSYKFDMEGMLSVMFCDEYLLLMKNELDKLSFSIMEMVLLKGNLYVSEILEEIKNSANGSNLTDRTLSAINSLLKSKYLIKSNSDGHLWLDISRIKEALSDPSVIKAGTKRHLEEPWDSILLLNYAYLKMYYRNDIIIKDAELSVGKAAGTVLKIFMNYMENAIHEPISTHLFLKHIRSIQGRVDEDEIDNCITLLTQGEDVTYLEEIDNMNGSLLRFNVEKVIEQIVIKILSDSVQVIFGDHGLKIFSYLLHNPYSEESIFRNSLMINKSQMDNLLPAMLSRGFVSKLELSKTKLYFDEPLTSLLHVDLEKLVRNEQQTCYQSLYRLSVRLEHENMKEDATITKMFDMSCKDKSLQTVDTDETISIITDLDKATSIKQGNVLDKLYAAAECIKSTLILMDNFLEQRKKVNF